MRVFPSASAPHSQNGERPRTRRELVSQPNALLCLAWVSRDRESRYWMFAVVIASDPALGCDGEGLLAADQLILVEYLVSRVTGRRKGIRGTTN